MANCQIATNLILPFLYKSRSHTICVVAVCDIVVKYVPDGYEHLSGDGHLHFHLVLASYDSLRVTEPVVETPLGMCSRP